MKVVVADDQLSTLLEWVKKIPGSEMLKFLDPVVHVIATDHTALKTLLQSPDVLNLTGKIVFTGVTSDLIPVVTAVLTEQRVQYDLADRNFFLKTTKDKLKIHSIPEGFHLCRLQHEESNFINSFWKFNNDASNSYIKHLIKTRPSSGLYNKEEDLIGFALTYHYGAVGMLHVLEEYRGKGYAKVIISHLTDKCLKAGIDVFSIIDTDNIASLKVHKDVGFEILPNHCFQWICCN